MEPSGCRMPTPAAHQSRARQLGRSAWSTSATRPSHRDPRTDRRPRTVTKARLGREAERRRAGQRLRRWADSPVDFANPGAPDAWRTGPLPPAPPVGPGLPGPLPTTPPTATPPLGHRSYAPPGPGSDASSANAARIRRLIRRRPRIRRPSSPMPARSAPQLPPMPTPPNRRPCATAVNFLRHRLSSLPTSSNPGCFLGNSEFDAWRRLARYRAGAEKRVLPRSSAFSAVGDP